MLSKGIQSVPLLQVFQVSYFKDQLIYSTPISFFNHSDKAFTGNLNMTFLGWMHRKLIHNTAKQTKNSIIGNPCFPAQIQFDEQNYCLESTKAFSHSKTNFHKSLERFESDEVEGLFQEESFEPFEFLAIGTFGMELLSTDPPTPKLPVPSKDLTTHQIERTENELRLANYELEKFIEAEEKETVNETSARSSQASIITLSHKPIEGAESDGQTYFTTFPLQNYLFATSVEVADTNNDIKKEKTSLKELFMRNNIAHDDPTRELEGAEKCSRKRNIMYFMKKVIKKLHSTSSCSTAASKDEATAPISVKKKLSKALKMLQKKVHPEEMTDKHIPHKDVCKIKVDYGHKIVDPAGSKKSAKNTKKLSSDDIYECASEINGGRWIKTDNDYLVLEL